MSKDEKYNKALDDSNVKGVNKAKTPKKNVSTKTIIDEHWQGVKKVLLAYKGIFYPKDSEFFVKPFSSEEVIYFTAIDEENPMEIDRAMKYLLQQCVKVTVGGKVVDTLEFTYNFDRFTLVLLARTYSDMRTDLTFEHICKNRIGNKTCNHEQKVLIIPQNLVFFENKITKYWDEENQYFAIRIKSHNGKEEEYIYSPSTIKENTELFDFMMENRDEISDVDLKTFMKVFPYMRHKMGGLENYKEIYGAFTELESWEIVDMTRLFDKVNLDASNLVNVKCKKCEHMGDVPMRFPYGFRTVVIDKIEDNGFLL